MVECQGNDGGKRVEATHKSIQQFSREWNGETTPLDIIKAQDLTQDDLHLETIYLYKEFDSEEERTKR